MLHAFAFYGGLGLTVQAKGDLQVDGHHTVEDVGIVLGEALRGAFGEKQGSAALPALMFPWMKHCSLRRWMCPAAPIWSLMRRCPRSAAENTIPA